MNQLSFLASDGSVARQERDAGMARALQHAEAEVPAWGSLALSYLRRYAETHERFPGWFVTHAAGLSGAVPMPPTGKSWGAIFTKAARLGWIAKDGYAQDPNRHANPCPVWRSRVFRS